MFNKNKRRYDSDETIKIAKSLVLENDMINDKSQEMLSIFKSKTRKEINKNGK